MSRLLIRNFIRACMFPARKCTFDTKVLLKASTSVLLFFYFFLSKVKICLYNFHLYGVIFDYSICTFTQVIKVVYFVTSAF